MNAFPLSGVSDQMQTQHGLLTGFRNPAVQHCLKPQISGGQVLTKVYKVILIQLNRMLFLS